ncbi:MAG: DsbE family thiol:disulfide interchange protein [Rhodocyclaceae bacterium]|jgi:cytochrome c biogenesis protein CcmG/thiol:disulfide interchange protein DsbE|nr:DsbE family thiol:disulfide interchange protein [Rhodocyclaceae bacterium]
MNRFTWPLIIFVALVGLLAVGLNLNPREVPSPLIGKPAPDFKVAQLKNPEATFSPQEMRGKVWLLNVWASWCVSCREEHPVIVEYARKGLLPPVVGLDYKDKREDGLAWLSRFGDPYLLSAFDADGRVGIDYGVYGVPETYLIDKAGVIRFKQIGPITPEVMEKKILPLVKELDK